MKIGTVAVCNGGKLGLVTKSKRKKLLWGMSYVGIQLTGDIGGPWASRNPKIIGHITDFLEGRKTRPPF